MIIIVSVSTLVQLEIFKLTSLFYTVRITGDTRVHRFFFFFRKYVAYFSMQRGYMYKTVQNRENITAE